MKTHTKILLTLVAAFAGYTSSASATTVRALHFYTPSVKNIYGGSSQVLTKVRAQQSRIAASINANSVSTTFGAYYFESDYDTQDDPVRQVERLVDSTSQMSEVLDERDRVKADIVQGYFEMEPDGRGDLAAGVAKSWGSAVDHIWMASTSNPTKHVGTHEIAHNFGGKHNKGLLLPNNYVTVTYYGSNTQKRTGRLSSSTKWWKGSPLGTSTKNNREIWIGNRVSVSNYK